MSREIKFRFWDREFKKMRLTCMGLNRGVLTGDENGELMQFTGLLDKNGRESYHSDFVKLHHGDIVEIKWSENDCAFYLKGKRHYPPSLIKYGEIIGNIYENPELLVNPKEKV